MFDKNAILSIKILKNKHKWNVNMYVHYSIERGLEKRLTKVLLTEYWFTIDFQSTKFQPMLKLACEWWLRSNHPPILRILFTSVNAITTNAVQPAQQASQSLSLTKTSKARKTGMCLEFTLVNFSWDGAPGVVCADEVWPKLWLSFDNEENSWAKLMKESRVGCSRRERGRWGWG
jgi:hypothetical protein